jgi:hypothetical protein
LSQQKHQHECFLHCWNHDHEVCFTLLLLVAVYMQIKCQFGAVVPGPGPISVQASAVMFDGRKAKAKHTVHLELRADFFKSRSLGSCIRIREWQQVQDSVTGKASYELLTSGGHIPEDGVEVCQGRTWSSIIRVGPLNPHTSHECQAVKFKSCVQGFPLSGYQGELKSDGIVDVHTKNCQRDFDDADSEDDSKVRGGRKKAACLLCCPD